MQRKFIPPNKYGYTENGKEIKPRPAGNLACKVVRTRELEDKVCRYCGEPIVWIREGSKYSGWGNGRWTPLNKDGSRHSWSCKILEAHNV